MYVLLGDRFHIVSFVDSVVISEKFKINYCQLQNVVPLSVCSAKLENDVELFPISAEAFSYQIKRFNGFQDWTILARPYLLGGKRDGNLHSGFSSKSYGHFGLVVLTFGLKLGNTII